MTNFEEMLIQYADGNYDCAKYSGQSYDEYQSVFLPTKNIEKQLIDRDKKLVAALKYIVEHDPRGIHWHLAAKAKEALKSVGEVVQ